MKYFKVKTGFEPEDIIHIDESELEKAIYAQISGRVAMLKGGTIRGNNIISITEDWHRAMGYNQGYELGPEDFEHINQKLGDSYNGVIGEKVEAVQFLIDTNQTHLIGKNVDIKKLQSSGKNFLDDEISKLADDKKA